MSEPAAPYGRAQRFRGQSGSFVARRPPGQRQPTPTRRTPRPRPAFSGFPAATERVPIFAELAERKSVLCRSHEAGNPENAARSGAEAKNDV